MDSKNPGVHEEESTKNPGVQRESAMNRSPAVQFCPEQLSRPNKFRPWSRFKKSEKNIKRKRNPKAEPDIEKPVADVQVDHEEVKEIGEESTQEEQKVTDLEKSDGAQSDIQVETKEVPNNNWEMQAKESQEEKEKVEGEEQNPDEEVGSKEEPRKEGILTDYLDDQEEMESTHTDLQDSVKVKDDNVWYVDSSASNHMTRGGEWFKNMHTLQNAGYVQRGDDTAHPIAHTCDVPLSTRHGKAKYLVDVLHVSNITKTLVSIGQMVKQGFGLDSMLMAYFTNKDWLKYFKEVPKRGSKVKCRDVKPELWNRQRSRNGQLSIPPLHLIVCETPNHLETPQETPIYTVDDVQKKNLFGPSSLTELDTVYNMAVSEHSFTLLQYNEAFKKLELLQADGHRNKGANLLVDKLKGQLKDIEAALLKAEHSVDVVDAMHVEELKNMIGRLSLTLQTLQVVVEEKAPLDAMSNALKERDFTQEVEECTKAWMDFVRSMQVKRSTVLLFAPPPKVPPVDMGTLPLWTSSQLANYQDGIGSYQDSTGSYQCLTGSFHYQCNPEAEADAEVEIVGGYNCEENYPLVEVHVEKEGVLEKDSLENGDQVKNCPSMKDNEVLARDTSPSILQTIQMMQRERKRNGDARKPTEDVEGQTKTSKDQVEKETGENSNMEFGRKDAATRNIDNLDHIISEDTEIIIKKSEPPQETGDASMEAGGDASCAGGAGEDIEIISEKFEPPLENGDAPVNASVDASEDAICAGGAGEDMIEPPQENGDASVDASEDASCKGGAIGAGGAGGAVGANAAEYVRHDDGTVPHPLEDGCDARGVASYVRNDDGTVSRPWEDPRNIQFKSKPDIILDINGVLLTSIDKRCLVHFDVFVWTCCMKNKVEKMLRACFPTQFHQFKEILAQQDCVKDARFKLTGGKPIFYKKISDLWEKRAQYTATSTILVDDTQYKQLWNPPCTFCIVNNMENQNPTKILKDILQQQ
ncbi:hypothetical protein L7F22_042572 [Adiantum nelumboides]|nr:hypothetical protein [Adiantum nelumboides]